MRAWSEGWGGRVTRMAGAAAWLMASGCNAPPSGATGEEQLAILGGQPEPSLSSVVAMVDLTSGSMEILCSGTLIAENAVLTARHCVSNLVPATTTDIVNCAETTAATPRTATNFYVTTQAVLPPTLAGFHQVRDVLTPPNSDLLCGNDVAILVLMDNIAASEAVPLVPSMAPAVAGETYAAIGYGENTGVGDAGATAGTRRRLDGLVVACVGAGCSGGTEEAAEWQAAQGVCSGDSGGPALDAASQVIGVASRSAAGCSLSIYEQVSAQIPFLQSSVIQAAEVGGYQPPSWVISSTTPTAPSSSGGCALAPSRRPSSVLAALLLMVVAAISWRRGRRAN